MNNGRQTCWFGVIITLCFDSVFHFRFHETWFFIPMMFFLALLIPLLAYCDIAIGMMNAKLRMYQGSDGAGEI